MHTSIKGGSFFPLVKNTGILLSNLLAAMSTSLVKCQEIILGKGKPLWKSGYDFDLWVGCSRRQLIPQRSTSIHGWFQILAKLRESKEEFIKPVTHHISLEYGLAACLD